MDAEGWVEIPQLLASFRESEVWKDLSEADLYEMIEKSEKKRHEISDGKIRAFYGHSIPQKVIKAPQEPPEILYHGTARRFSAEIFEKGLKPQSRQYVHLSADRETAVQVGKRRDGKPFLLQIQARKAWSEGVKFYLGNDKVWLADHVPPEYFREADEG